MSFIKGRLNPGKEKVKFFTTQKATWGHVVIHDGWVLINNIAVHREGKEVTMVPGQILETDDVDVINFFRNDPKLYGFEILEVGVHTKTDEEVAKLKAEMAEVDAEIEKKKAGLEKVQAELKKKRVAE